MTSRIFNMKWVSKILPDEDYFSCSYSVHFISLFFATQTQETLKARHEERRRQQEWEDQIRNAR